MILNNGKVYYPLDFGKMIKDEKIYYDRNLRQKNYFYLDLNTSSRSTQKSTKNIDIGSEN